MSDTPRTGLKAGWILHNDKRPQRGAWAPGGYACHCVKCYSSYSGDKRSTMCADCAYSMPDEKAVSTSEFGGSEPLGIDYYKAKLEEARERVKKLEGVILELTAAGNCVEREKNQLLSILKNQGIFSQFGQRSTDNWIRAKEWDRKEKGLA